MKRLYLEAKEDDLAGAAAELAFRQFLALFPFFIFVASLGAFLADLAGVADPTQEIMNLIGGSLPTTLSTVLRNELAQVLESSDPRLASVGIIAAVWASSSGIQAVMKSLNKVFELKETRPFWLRYSLAVLLTVVVGTFLVLAFSLFLVGQIRGLQVADEIGLEGQLALLINIARWPVAILAVLLAVNFLYWFGPSARMKFRLLTPGSGLFTLAWVGSTYLFGLYVANFGSYNATYGTLGAVAVLLFWFYLTSFIFFLGAELDAILQQR
jgi:membrane protein